MPSRTYIQMLLKLHKNGKIFLSEDSLKTFKKCNAILENHPEAIEEIIQRRTDMVVYTKTLYLNTDITEMHMAIFEEIIINYMFIFMPDLNLIFNPNFNRIASGFEPIIFNGVIVSVNGKENNNEN